MNTQLTIIDQVKRIETQSETPLEIDITVVANLADRAKVITSVNDPDFLTVKKEMQKSRVYLTEYFMEARRGFNRLSEGVRDVEKAVLSTFTPEEDRLIALDKAEKERVIKEERLAALPAKRERITTAMLEFTDEEILTMTDADFELEFATRLAAKAEADRLAAEQKLAEERAAFEAEKAELARKQAEADRIEAARIEERERAEKALQLAKETAEREAKEAEERRKAEEQERILKAEREKAEAEAERLAAIKAKEEAEAKQAADEKWQAFLKANSFNQNTDIIIEGNKIYRLVATYE